MSTEGVETDLSDDGLTQVVETPAAQRPLSEQLDDILREAASPPEEPAETQPPDAPLPAEKWDIKTVAEKLGTDPAQLYNALTVSLGDEELTVGQLKDRLKPQKDFEVSQQQLVRERGELEADRLAARREIAALQSGDREAYERGRSEYLSREREALLRAIPEWADAAVVTADRKRIGDLVREFGFPETVLDQVEDHRLFRLLRAYERDRAELTTLRAEKAKASQPKPKVAVQPRSGAPPTEAQRFGRIKAAVTKGQMTKGAAIDAILRDAGVK